MITGELKSKIDRIWDIMWSGGISNPLSVIEQLTYLLFIKRLDELHTRKEAKAARTGKPIEGPIFAADQDRLRWSRFKEAAPEQMFETVRDGVFPFIKTLGQKGDADGEGGSTYTHHMKDALFMMPTARVLASVVDQLDDIDMADSDTKGDLYEYMLGKIATAGQNGQFRTPRHIIKLMVDMTAPTPKDVICDPACGTAGFLIAASENLVEHHSDTIYKDAAARRRFNEDTFHGYDFDNTMLRIGSMNMLLHGVENPDIRYKDSLAQADDDAEKYSLILANPPFAGSLDYASTAKDLQQVVRTMPTELLFLALSLRLLQTGGRAAVIVPDGVLFGSSNAHKALRKILVEDQKLDAIVSMPSGVFKPYAGVSTAILLFTKTNSGGTDNVWFYDMQADGYSLDDRRTPQPDKSDLADILARWQKRDTEGDRARTDQSFLVPKAEIADNDYDLSLNRYKEVEYEAVEYAKRKLKKEAERRVRLALEGRDLEEGGGVSYNQKLRNRETLTEAESADIDAVISTIDEAAPLPAMTLYRAIPREFAAEFPVGTLGQDRSFVSACKSPELARAYVEDAYGEGEAIVLRIHVPAGAKGLDLKDLIAPDHIRVREEEIILGLGSTFEVQSVDMDKGYIDLSLMLPGASL